MRTGAADDETAVAGEEGRKYVGVVGTKQGGRGGGGRAPAVPAARLREGREKPKREGEEGTRREDARGETPGKKILGGPIRGGGEKRFWEDAVSEVEAA